MEKIETTGDSAFDQELDELYMEDGDHNAGLLRVFNHRRAERKPADLSERVERVMSTRSELCDELSDAFEDGRREAFSEVREERARKRGERPANPYTTGPYQGIGSDSRAVGWDEAAATIEAWCNTGDSDEMAALRAELTDKQDQYAIVARATNEAQARADRLAATLREVLDRVAALQARVEQEIERVGE